MTTLVDVLKGSRTSVVNERGLFRIKTFGAGSNDSALAWKLFLQQLLQQGVFEIDYKEHYRIKLTNLSQAILFEDRKVQLVSPDTIRERLKRQKEKPKRQLTTATGDEALYDHLRDIRKDIADKLRKPPYVVFSNATLSDMTAIKPTSMEELLEVHGVGEHKAKKFGPVFIAGVQEYLHKNQ